METRHDRTLIADMNHELLSPLNAIIGSSDVLLEKYFGDLTARQEAFVRDIRESGTRLLDLIHDLLALAQPDSGKEERREVGLAAILRTTLGLVTERALKHRVRITLSIADGTPSVTSEPSALKKALFFLISDAVTFASDGGAVAVELADETGAASIAVTSRAADGEVFTVPESPRVTSIVERLGGRIAVDASGPTHTVRVRLPRAGDE